MESAISVGVDCGETTYTHTHACTRTHTHARRSAAHRKVRVKTPPRGNWSAPLCRPRTSTAHHSAVRLCGASGSPPASNPYCPSIFLLAVAIFEPISSRSPPPSALLPAPSCPVPSPIAHRPSSIVHRPSCIVHRAQHRPQALILRPPAWRRTDLIPSSACAHGQEHGSSSYPLDTTVLSAVCCLLWAVGT